MRVGIYTLGCKVNIYESEYVEELLKNHGYEIVPFTDSADIYIINTCSVTNDADKKSRKMIHQARKRNDKAIVVVMGCYSQTHADSIDADIIIGSKDKGKILTYLSDYLQEKRVIKNLDDVRENVSFEDMTIHHFDNHTRAFVKIQDGCNAFCSYCIIPYARGVARSKRYEDVVFEVEQLVSNGYQEIVLTGIHTGRYGEDLENMNLEKLLRRLIQIPNLYRIRLSSIEVNEITDGIIDIIKNSKIIARHLHIPLQSGSDKILRKMNRRYDVQYFMDKVVKIRENIPDVSLTTDLIVGFPGETEEDFLDTLTTLQKIGFTKIHTFPYSKREGTPASVMENQVDGVVKKRRVKEVLKLSSCLEHQFYLKYLNQTLDGLSERYKDGKVSVLTSNYIQVLVSSEIPNNKRVLVKITDVLDDNQVFGEVIEKR